MELSFIIYIINASSIYSQIKVYILFYGLFSFGAYQIKQSETHRWNYISSNIFSNIESNNLIIRYVHTKLLTWNISTVTNKRKFWLLSSSKVHNARHVVLNSCYSSHYECFEISPLTSKQNKVWLNTMIQLSISNKPYQVACIIKLRSK